MSEVVGDDLRLVMLAPLAWLYEHDLGRHAETMDPAIDRDELAAALDRMGEGAGVR